MSANVSVDIMYKNVGMNLKRTFTSFFQKLPHQIP